MVSMYTWYWISGKCFTIVTSTHTAPLWELLKRTTYQEAFNQIKQLVCKDTTLRYFDVQKPTTVQVDASKKGLGATPLQEVHPVTFASKALTPTEQWYANIECEMLACVFGAEWFHTCVFGCAFTIESNHKPLEQINLKNLADTPVWLQWILLSSDCRTMMSTSNIVLEKRCLLLMCYPDIHL